MTINIDEIDVPVWQRDLVYIDYRDGLTPEQVEQIIHGEWSDDLDEWISDAQWDRAGTLAIELLTDVGVEYDDNDRYALMERLIEMDSSTPYADLLGHTASMLFRYSPTEDGMAFLCEELEDPVAATRALGLDESFLPYVTEILPEIAGYKWEGGGYFGATFVFYASPADVAACVGHERIQVKDPFLWLTNPYSGNGYGVVATGCSVVLPMADVHVDRFAWGYGADDVFGGLLLNDSTVEVVE